MSTQTELPPVDETANLKPVGFTSGPFTLFATIKKSSKYYRQGLGDDNKPYAFKIRQIDDFGDYRFHGNSNQYRAEDLIFWIKKSDGKFTRIS
ncbi:hypothetical protein [Geminisphaera colitermitum]|uniref:hypothetical protein n=1 Tax=Geminisphaera colitermitum TaxID=1148786 RepID=UPI000158D115|nr:hypothetical protein [Geminisphaera colitermitum]